ncbi:MAG: bifunctional folylpolyglutamate synthase/dihydrofolate synthase [Deltaproteobacteria bacterium]|nr:MAG: bifunctional folylpolyglutamate synthase/dihydrofolate synthase [Deltaproteobacteria bacterium]
MNYDEALDYLDSLQMHKIKLGLDAMQSLLALVGRPERELKTIHVAGTNGKGSVCAAMANVLASTRYRVGVYTSPHLSSVRERFKIGDTYISKETFARLASSIRDILGVRQITYFEFTTTLALLWFAESAVDLVLLETGMGGRLDATNVVTPLVAVITSISEDHQAYLGDSLSAIAYEKAGIVKPGVPVVSAAVERQAAKVIEKRCLELKAPLYRLGRDFEIVTVSDQSWVWKGGEAFSAREIGPLSEKSISLVQRENDALSIAALLLLEGQGISVEDRQIEKGLSRLVWPGRMELLQKDYTGGAADLKGHSNVKQLRYLLDGAHNIAGVENLVKTLQRCFPSRRLIGLWGAMEDKDIRPIIDLIAPVFARLVLTRVDSQRSASPEYLASFVPDAFQEKISCYSSFEDALQEAQRAADAQDLIVVGGSLYLVGAVRWALCGGLV